MDEATRMALARGEGTMWRTGRVGRKWQPDVWVRHSGTNQLVLLTSVLVVGAALTTWAADTAVPQEKAESERSARILADLKYLADDEREGRGVGTKGLDQAADYVRDEFAKAGLDTKAVKGGAFQTFSLTTGAKLGEGNALAIVGPNGGRTEYKVGEHFIPLSFGGAGSLEADLVFAGYGIDAKDEKFEEYANLDVKGKVVVIVRKAPKQAATDGPFNPGHGGISRHADLQTKVAIAFGKGAAGVLFVNDPYTSKKELEDAKKSQSKVAESVAEVSAEMNPLLDKMLGSTATDKIVLEQFENVRKRFNEALTRYAAAKAEVAKGAPDTLMRFGYGGDESTRSIPIIHVQRGMLEQALSEVIGKNWNDWEAAIDAEMKPIVGPLTGWKIVAKVAIDRQSTEVKNVIAVLPGEGPLAEETIVVGAHYDHVGRGGKGSLAPGSTDIHNGADDNASGTACLLEVARRLAARKEKLPRRVVLIAFTAEELGLFGSARYTKEPVFPLDSTIAMLNMDMVGRLAGEKLIVYGTGTAAVWDELLKAHGEPLGFQFSLKPEGFGPSDHSSFYAKNIPVLHFFTGNHNDYHRPSDDWEKINLSGVDRVAELTEKLVVDLAKAPERPKYISVAGTANPLRDGTRPYFGSLPDFGVEEPGYALGGVAPGSPAEKGGLKAGDRIIQLGPHKIDNLSDFDLHLRKFSADDTVEVTVMRGKEKVVLKVTLGKPRG